MLIGIDGNEANVVQRVGVGRYAYELLNQLFQLRVASCEFRIYLKEKPLPDLPPAKSGWQYQVVSPKKFWTQIGLPWALLTARLRPDVFFTPSHYVPRFSCCPRVMSVMDLSFLYFPRMFRKKDFWQLKSWTRYSILKAKKVCTISQSTKNDIIKHYQVAADKVVVTYPGFEMKKKPANQAKIKAIKKKYQIKTDYLLSVGTLQPRKNYPRLIEAFAKLDNPFLELVIVGKHGWLWQEIYQAPKKFGVETRVKFLNFVPDEDLAVLYQAAKCFILVSLYEGFGIPVLEAMTFGCPVVASNISSLPEVVGRAGVLVDPNKAEDIARGIEEAIKNREGLIKKGYLQAKKFSWQKCAQKTLEVLNAVKNN